VPTLSLLEGRAYDDRYDAPLIEGGGRATVYTFDGDVEKAVEQTKRDLEGKGLKLITVPGAGGATFHNKELMIMVVPGVSEPRNKLTGQQQKAIGASAAWREEKGKVSIIIQERSRDAFGRLFRDLDVKKP
jgi:hypothetical protein